ncbi:alpha-L-arabinofuranosidase B [Kitasatospora sp. NPDC057198]|uniref:alpha-L-arabinofuranosidase B n=1 Tax=Kitasatospora sp. NPDC057198 TaxID=3346046 RepID=UPI00363C4C72
MSALRTSPLPGRLRRWSLSAGTVVALIAGVLVGGTRTSQAADSLPCDLYAAGGTPCVAAHSTTRALYSAYSGPLYRVRRASDGTTKDIGVLGAGGYADAAAQDAFCAGTNCLITLIHDQSGRGNDLNSAPTGYWPGPGPDRTDNLADATAAPVTVGGHKAYGVFVAPGTGYRDNRTNGVATGDDPEGMYAVLDGTHSDKGCCFDYGNAETTGNDDGNGTMEAVYFGTSRTWGSGAGSGPWIMADLENGLFSGVNRGYNAGDPTIDHRFTTATLKGGPDHWAIRGGNAESGGLSTFYDGVRPDAAGYDPMKKQGAIVLGIGGDNSNASAGTFYEGVMTSGYPSDSTEDAVQADINSVGYTVWSSGLVPGARISLKATTACCTGHYLRHDAADSDVVISPVSSSSAGADRANATWIVRAGLADSACVSFESADNAGQFLRHAAFELRLNADDGSRLFARDATFCPHPGNNGQGLSFPSLGYPEKEIRHFEYTGYLAGDGGSNTWDSKNYWYQDTTWLVASPLS